MKTKNRKYDVIDYIFWFLLVILANPGGIFQAFGEDTSKVGNIDMLDYITALLFGCFLFVFYKNKIKNATYRKIVKYLIFFGLYYLIVFGYFVPIFKENPGYTPFSFLKKSRKTIYSLLMFVMTYRFYLRSYVIFYKTLIISSIIVLTLFFLTFLTGVEILPISKANRGFVQVDRIFIASEGLMLLLIPIGAIIIVFKSKIKKRGIILLSFSMMFLNYILSITRRDIIGTFIIFFIAMVLYNYIQRKNLIPVKNLVSVAFYLLIFTFFISFSFPKYFDAGVTGIEESANIIQTGETSSGKEDVRLGLGKDFMQNLIIDNTWFGTGFDNRWRGTGDKLGYEARDYPFLSAIAMTGVFGILIFLPIYIILLRGIIYDVKFLRKHKINFQTSEFHILILFIVFFIYDLLQYMNWFFPVSLSRSSNWYIYLAMYFASRQIFYDYYAKNKIRQNIKQI
jgi:hypothetical protein